MTSTVGAANLLELHWPPFKATHVWTLLTAVKSSAVADVLQGACQVQQQMGSV